jgi:hypothetical protein
VITSGGLAVNFAVAFGTALRVEQALLKLLIPAMVSATILHPSLGFAQTCSGEGRTTTPASPPNSQLRTLSQTGTFRS